jgi:hypothetical protein
VRGKLAAGCYQHQDSVATPRLFLFLINFLSFNFRFRLMAGDFFLHAQKEVTKKKGTPG